MSTAPTEQSRVSRPLLIGLGVIAVAAVAYLALTQLGGGAEQDSADGAEPAVAASETAEESEAAVEPAERGSEVAAVEPTFEVFDARDPFEQLVADTTATDATVGTTVPTATTPVDGTQPASSTTPVDGTQPDSGDPSQTTVGATTILLEDVFTVGGVETALIVVDNKGFEAVAGDTVAGEVTVLDIARNCATMRFEDRRFILCEGERVQK